MYKKIIIIIDVLLVTLYIWIRDIPSLFFIGALILLNLIVLVKTKRVDNKKELMIMNIIGGLGLIGLVLGVLLLIFLIRKLRKQH